MEKYPSNGMVKLMSPDAGSAVQTAKNPKRGTANHWAGVKISEYAGNVMIFFRYLLWNATNKAVTPTRIRHHTLV